MQLLRVGAATAFVVGGLAVAPEPARATMEGGCTAVATFLLGTGTGSITVDVNTANVDDPVEIGSSDTVLWQVAVPGAPTEPRPMRGRIEIDLPWPFGTQTIEDWSGTATAAGTQGTYEYSFTGAFPRGVPFLILGTHGEPGVGCTGEVALQVDGGPLDAWITYVALGGLVLSGIGLYFAGRSRWVGVG